MDHPTKPTPKPEPSPTRHLSLRVGSYGAYDELTRVFVLFKPGDVKSTSFAKDGKVSFVVMKLTLPRWPSERPNQGSGRLKCTRAPH